MKFKGGSCCPLLLVTAAAWSLIISKHVMCSELPPEEAPANAMEPLTERLVKQSNLLAEESRVEGAAVIIVEPPKQMTTSSQSMHEDEFTGGPGDTYISMSNDGSSRYRFGFDTKQSQTKSAKSTPRLLREESRLEDGTVVGRYGYTDPFGVFRIVQYVAGPEGYFASEHVGALAESGDRTQLNKQLRTAIELARHRARRLPVTSTTPQPQNQYQHQERHTRDSSSRASSSTISFAANINHIIGSNGRSYSTAFRPMNSRRSMNPTSNREQQPHREPIEMRYERVSPAKTPPVYESSRAFGEVLKSSPAWSVLSNTYNEQDIPLIINHNSPPDMSLDPVPPVSARATATLSQLSNVGSSFQQEFSEEARKLASIQDQRRSQLSSANQPLVFGARSPTPSQVNNVNNNQQIYLSTAADLNPPLYHPEVHSTEQEHASQTISRGLKVEEKPVVSSIQAGRVSVRRGTSNYNVHEHPIKYATRLSALSNLRHQQQEANESIDELIVDASEQVATNTSSRAKIPDRSKKLSAILKPRNNLQSDDQAKIKRPTPLSMKRHASKPVEVSKEKVSGGVVSNTQELPVESANNKTPALPKVHTEKKFGKAVSERLNKGIGQSVDSSPQPEIRAKNATAQSNSFSSSAITLIDTMQNNAESVYDRELYEKIVKIQQEIAAKNLNLLAPSVSTTTEAQSSFKIDQVSSSTLAPPTESISTTSSSTQSSTTTTESVSKSSEIEATASTIGSIKPSLFVAQYIEPAPAKEEHQTKVIQTSSEQQTLPTGPLLVMDTSSMDQVELFSNSTLNIDPFDSARGSTTSAPSSDTADGPTVRISVPDETSRLPDVESSSVSTTSEPLRPTTTAASVSSNLFSDSNPGNATNLNTDLLATNKTLIQVNDTITTSQPTTTQATYTTSTSPTTKTTSTTSTTTTTTTPASSTIKSFENPSTQEPILSSSTSSSPLPTTTPTDMDVASTSSVTVPTTTTTTSTRTPATLLRPTNGQPRFGRLVIKREGKVVARFDGTDPIPDSLIPIGTGLVGNGEATNGEALIVPDMPRMSMRRAVKRKAGSLLNAALLNNLTVVTTTTQPTSSSSTTKDPLLSEASEWSPVRRSSKRRGTRSSSLNAVDSRELVAAETVDNPEIKLSEQQNNKIRALKFTSYRRARSWSDRIRGDIATPLPAPTNISYQPKEDLRKMVEKIEKHLMIPEVSSERSTTTQPSVHTSSTTQSIQPANYTSHQSQSSSATFTIPILSNQYPTQVSQLKIQSKLVDSNPQIQLKHNQSLTVHVDIEPPNRQQSIAKRLVSRDTQASTSPVSLKDDLLRTAKVSTPTASSVEQQSAKPILSRTVQEIKEETSRRKRNPRMLCIEVDAGASL